MLLRQSILAALLFIIPSCAGWQKTVDTILIRTHQSAKATSAAAEPVFKVKCTLEKDKCKVADTCKGKTVAECKKLCTGLTACLDDHHAVNKAIIKVHQCVARGRAYLALGLEKQAIKLVPRLLDILKAATRLAAKHKVFGKP